jgi:hypothetical protein
MKNEITPSDILPSRKLRKNLAELIDSNHVGQAVAAIEDGLSATRRFWSPITKSFVDEPDHKTRLDAAKTILAYHEGTPVQRVLTATESFESLREALANATHSKEAQQLLQGLDRQHTQ